MAETKVPNPFTAQLATPPTAGLAVFATLQMAKGMWDLLDAKPGRETAIAKTKLEEMVFWACRGLKE